MSQLLYLYLSFSATPETFSTLYWICERSRQSVILCSAIHGLSANFYFAPLDTCDPWIAHEIHGLCSAIHGLSSNLYFAPLNTCDPWIAHEIHGLSCKVRIHGLHSAIRELCKSILYTQHIYTQIFYHMKYPATYIFNFFNCLFTEQ